MNSAQRGGGVLLYVIHYSPYLIHSAVLAALLEGLNKKDASYVLFCFAVLSVAIKIRLIARQSLLTRQLNIDNNHLYKQVEIRY